MKRIYKFNSFFVPTIIIIFSIFNSKMIQYIVYYVIVITIVNYSKERQLIPNKLNTESMYVKIYITLLIIGSIFLLFKFPSHWDIWVLTILILFNHPIQVDPESKYPMILILYNAKLFLEAFQSPFRTVTSNLTQPFMFYQLMNLIWIEMMYREYFKYSKRKKI